MPWSIVCAALIALAPASGIAQDSAAPAKDAVAAEAIIKMCGGSQAKMFADYGAPTQLWADRGATEAEDDVFLGYGSFGFKVRDDVVRVCFFFKRWEGPIRG